MSAAAIIKGLAELAQALRDGLSEVARAIEAASDDIAVVIETASGNIEEKLAGIDGELSAGNRELVNALRGIEDALREPQRTKGKPCRRGT